MLCSFPCSKCHGEATGSSNYPLNKKRGREKLHGTEGVKRDGGTEAGCTIRGVPASAPPGKQLRGEEGAMASTL